MNERPDAADGVDAPGGAAPEHAETGFEIVARRAPRAATTEPPKKRRRGSFWLLRLPYDRAFHPAVVRGYISIWQAMERGKRTDYALHIATRYGLSPRRAILVTDNRLTIARALGLTGAVPYDLAPIFEPQSERSAVKWAIAAALLFGGLYAAPIWLERAVYERPESAGGPGASEQRPPSRVPSIQVAASVRVDAQGQPTEVIAHTPGAVVEAYCRLLGPAVKPGGVVAHGRGFMGSLTRDGRVLAIEIKRDRKSGMWRVGDGRAPIAVFAPTSPPGGARRAGRARRRWRRSNPSTAPAASARTTTVRARTAIPRSPRARAPVLEKPVR